MNDEHTTDGGPAFPRVGIWNPDKPGWTNSPQAGMSLLEYFAAHAPAEIAKEVEVCASADLLHRLRNDEGRSRLAQAYLAARQVRRQQCDAIDEARRSERFFAWRWAYAAKMVEMRNRQR